MTTTPSMTEAANNINRKNQDVAELMGKTIRVLHRFPREMLTDMKVPFLIYVHAVSKLPITINLVVAETEQHKDGEFVLAVPMDEYDPAGWLDEEGLTLAQRVPFAFGKHFRGGAWRQIDAIELIQMAVGHIVPFHPAFRLKDLATVTL